MNVLAAIAGLCLLALVSVDAFETLLLARRTRHIFRIARVFYGITWEPFALIGKRITSPMKREGFLSIYGPLSVILLFGIWAMGLVLGFALLQWAAGMKPMDLPQTFSTDVYLSATTLFTLATGDPQNSASKGLSAAEGGVGLGLLGLGISYLPVLYQSFSSRELSISMLDARAGSPPSAGSLVSSAPDKAERIEHDLAQWEEWAAQLLENHLSFPMLAYFRSQHPNQSWLTALVAIIDFAALTSLAAKGDLKRQADLTFAMGRHVLADFTVMFGLEEEAYSEANRKRLSQADQDTIEEEIGSRPIFSNCPVRWHQLAGRQRLYEPHALALSQYFLMSLPNWTRDEISRDNWRVPIAERDEAPFAVSDPFSSQDPEDRAPAARPNETQPPI